MTIWHLCYERDYGNGGDFDTYVDGGIPRPMNEHSVPWRVVPADVRAFAQHYGKVNGATHVTYRVARLVRVAGFASTGQVSDTAMDIEQHDEEIA